MVTPLDQKARTQTANDPLIIAGQTFNSRLLIGTGKYRNTEQMQQSIIACGCEVVTVAVRRVPKKFSGVSEIEGLKESMNAWSQDGRSDVTQVSGSAGLTQDIDWSQVWMLPNTAGCQTAEEAVRVAKLGREMARILGQEDNNFVKLEVIADAKYLLPDPIGTLKAAEQLVKDGFAVLPYVNSDPVLSKNLEEVGCAAVMPMASLIGSGRGVKNAENLRIIIENANVPVLPDSGIGVPSEASEVMEMGADGVLMNTAIAQARNPAAMAEAMGMAVKAGRQAFLAGRIVVKDFASTSSPLTGMITQ